MKKRKVAIITTHSIPNYGNKLQNYALQTFLQSMGFYVETISDARSWIDMRSFWDYRKILLHFLIRIRTTTKHIKYAKFFIWSKIYIKYAKTTIRTNDDINRISNCYDFYVVGSDQIWNPEFRFCSNEFGFATFASKEKKIAYAPSIAISYLPKNREEDYKKWLQDWKALSCRELEGAKIIEQIVHYEIPVVVDPTLLLTANTWKKLAISPIKHKRYVLLYTIGELKDEYKNYITNIRAEKNIEIISLNEGKYSGCGPSEFLGIIQNAEFMITDSFHGSLFALLFHTPLVIFTRYEKENSDQISRIKTLFKHANIQDRDFTKTINEYFELNWNLIDESFAKSRNESIMYLEKNLK